MRVDLLGPSTGKSPIGPLRGVGAKQDETSTQVLRLQIGHSKIMGEVPEARQHPGRQGTGEDIVPDLLGNPVSR